ncbi:protein NRT1/ PTR FAMILY 5.2-like [Carex rostrata]
MCLLTLSVSLPSLKSPACGANTINPTCTQKASPWQLGIFFLSLYILAIGTGGTKPNISTIDADQFDVFDPKERFQKLSFFNWWMFSIFFGTLFANIVLVYIQDNVGWTLGYALPTLGLIISVVIFLTCTPFYRHKLPSGSSFMKMSRVLVAACRKRQVSVPSDPMELHELELTDYKEKKQFMMESSYNYTKVDTNVGRICVRLWWVPLKPLPESVQIHLLEMYPVIDSIQKYLWPPLCKLDQEILYELHYQMITFGKVFCTKRKPNCKGHMTAKQHVIKKTLNLHNIAVTEFDPKCLKPN